MISDTDAKAQHTLTEEAKKTVADRPFRVAVVVDGTQQTQWLHRVLSELRKASCATIARTLLIPPPEPLPRNHRHTLFDAYAWLDRRVFRRHPDPLLPMDSAALLDRIPRLTFHDAHLTLTDTEMAALQGDDLDVILHLTPSPPPSHLATVARLGVWYFPHHSLAESAVETSWFSATINGEPTIDLQLEALTKAQDKPVTLYTSPSAANRFSGHHAGQRALWKAAIYPLRALQALHTGGSYAEAPPSIQPNVESTTPPTNLKMLPLGFKLAAGYAHKAVEVATTRPHWFLAYKDHTQPGRPDSLLDLSLGDLRIISAAPGQFWADPFPVTIDQTTHVFIEVFDYAQNRGHIAVFELRNDGTLSDPVPVLKRPYHLSYPFVFSWRNDWYMTPETGENRTIELYRCTAWPYEWELVAELANDLFAADTTLAEIEGAWWMFTSIAPFGGSENDELHLFRSETPLGPWHPHPRNPVISDVRRARPAGRIVQQGGAWYRPSQDCSRLYGYALNINRITRLSMQEYVEETVRTVRPTWSPGIIGTHTVNQSERVTFIDGLRRQRRFLP